MPAQSQWFGPFGRLQGFLPVDLGGGDPAPLVFDPDTQHPRVDSQFAGNLGDRAVRIDHDAVQLTGWPAMVTFVSCRSVTFTAVSVPDMPATVTSVSATVPTGSVV